MRVRALAFRILNQLRHDRRTLALMLVAPVFLLTLVYFILADTVPVVNVAVINAPAGFEDRLEEQNVRGLRYSESEARRALEQGEVIATISISGGKSTIEVDGSNPTKAKVALAALEQAKMSSMLSRPDLKSEVNYVYGQEDLPSFDNFGATLIGFIIFFFVLPGFGYFFLAGENLRDPGETSFHSGPTLGDRGGLCPGFRSFYDPAILPHLLVLCLCP